MSGPCDECREWEAAEMFDVLYDDPYSAFVAAEAAILAGGEC